MLRPLKLYPVNHCQVQVRENGDLFIFEITSPISSFPPPSSMALPFGLLVCHVYSKRPPQKPSDSCPPPLTSLPSDLGPSDNLSIALRKGEHTCAYLVSLFVSYT